MSVTELNLTPGRQEFDWKVNVTESAASGGIDLRPAAPETRYGFKAITVTPNMANKWFQIMDGENLLIGPVGMPQNVTYKLSLESPIYGTIGNALVLQTEEDFWIHLVIEGVTCPPQPSVSASPSSSPSV